MSQVFVQFSSLFYLHYAGVRLFVDGDTKDWIAISKQLSRIVDQKLYIPLTKEDVISEEPLITNWIDIIFTWVE